MSMLAERKRKTKWVINPTKTPLWAQDSSGIKFGKELMEKMGWSAGKGLGLKEQGIEEPLRISYKNDTKGMGFKGRDDEWIEQQDEFNLLLSQLSNSNYTAAVENSEIKKPKSLELKSKHSRARVHYRKFTRGKDLSNYSEKDLACILGINKTKEEKSKPEITIKTEGKSEYETTFGVTTINSGSIEDYFKKKSSFDKIKSNNLFKSSETTENLSSESLTDAKSIFPTDEESSEKPATEEKNHKKRKHKSEADTSVYEITENESEEKKHKKRKRKSEADTSVYETTENESEEKKHKKRKTSKSKPEPSKTDESEKYEVTEMEIAKEKDDECKTLETTIKKKKRKHDKTEGVSENKSQVSEDVERSHCFPEGESSEILKEKDLKSKNEEKKSKQEKHKLNMEAEKIILASTEHPIENEESRAPKEKKSKKKKHKSDLEIEESERSEVGNVDNVDITSEMDEKRNSQLGDIIEKKYKTERSHGSVETKNDLSSGVVDVSESNPVVMKAEAEGRNGVTSREGVLNEHQYTSERVLDLIRWADIKEFRGSNLSNVLGYGFKREYLRNKIG